MMKSKIFRSQIQCDSEHNAVASTNSSPVKNEIRKRKMKTNVGSVFELKKVLATKLTSTVDESNPDNEVSKSTSTRISHLGDRSGFLGNKIEQDQTSGSVR